MTVLVTGGTGLVGARLLPRLVKAGIECRALLRPGKGLDLGVPTVEGDLLDLPSLTQAMSGVSTIIHLAAVFRTPDTDLIWKSNLEGTRNLIAAVKAHAPAARFIMASTAWIYDMDTARPSREEDDCSPTLDYPASKLAAEKELRTSGLTWVIQRFGFVYGDGDGHIESLPALVKQADFHPARRMSMVHHRDIATAITLALTGAMDGRIVNIADEAPTSFYELAELAGEPIRPSAGPLTNPWHIHMDASLARQFGFRPVVRTVHQAAQEGSL